MYQITQQKELIFLEYIKTYPSVYISKVRVGFFKSEHIRALFKVIKTFYNKYHKIPTKENVYAILMNNETRSNPFYKKELETDELTFDTPLFKELTSAVNCDQLSEDWVENEINTWVKYNNLESSLEEVIEITQKKDINPDNISEIIQNVKDVITTKNDDFFADDFGIDILDKDVYIKKESTQRFSTGYEYFDTCMAGGFGRGELTVFAGPAKGGKSALLVNLASNVVRAGKNVAIVSLEMSEESYLQRLACNMLRITSEKYDKIISSKGDKQQVIEKLKKVANPCVKLGRMFIKSFPTSSTSTVDIENYLKSLMQAKQFQIDLVVLDYLSICSNWRSKNNDNLYTKLKTITEDFRAVIQRLECAGVSAIQLNRGAIGSSELSITSIAESMGVVHTVDNLFGIYSRDYDSVKNNRIEIGALALRNAMQPTDKAEFTVDFDRMKITEGNIGFRDHEEIKSEIVTSNYNSLEREMEFF